MISHFTFHITLVFTILGNNQMKLSEFVSQQVASKELAGKQTGIIFDGNE